MSALTIIPAIDLKGGRCVRLRQGQPDQESVYSADPEEMARRWHAAGAEWLHVVDLDGAFRGRPAHLDVIARIARAIPIPVELGGGLRTDADLDAALACGVARVVLGTRAWAEPEALQRLVKRYGEQLAVGLDARDGRVQVKGWLETTGVLAVDLARRADEMGVRTLICTDTATDGMLTGPNVRAMETLCRAVSCSVIASGGVASAEDVRALRRVGCPNLAGVIVGKALYEGRVEFRDLKEAAHEA